MRLVRGRTVPTEAFSGAATGTGTSDTVNQYSHADEQRLCVSRSSAAESPVSVRRTCSRAPTRSTCSSANRARAGTRTRSSATAVPLDTGFLVHNTPNYPLLCRLFGELGVRTHESEMSFSVSCADCGLEYSGRRPFAQAAERGEPALPRAPLGDRPVAADRAPVARRGRLRELVARRLPRRARLLAPVPLALPRAADGGALVDRARAGARVPGGVRDPLLREPRDARVRPLPLADRDRRKPRLRRGDRRPPRAAAAASASPVRSIRRTADGVELRAADGVARTLRQGGGRDARRRGLALLEDPSDGGAARARRVRLYGQRDRAAHRLVAPAARPGGARLVELPHRRRRAADTHLLPEQAAGARGRARLLRDAQPGRRGGARARAALVHPPALHRRDAAGAGGAAAGCRARGTRSMRARISATASTRTGSPPGSPLRPRSGWRW